MNKAGRPKSVFLEPVNISCQCEKWRHDIVLKFHISESAIYQKGADAVIQERIGDLTPENVHKIIQGQREEMARIQEEIMVWERLLFDAKVKDEKKQRQKTTIIHDDRGREVLAVYAE